MTRLCPVCGCQIQQQYASGTAGIDAGQLYCPQCNALVTEADGVDPIYCRCCHQPRLRFALSSEGYCKSCLLQMQQQRQALEAEKLRREEALRQAQEAKKQAVFNTDTGRGFCPQCGSRNIQELTVDTGGGSPEGAQEAACCVGCLFFWPALFLVPFLGKRGVKEMHRQCAACGWRWRI